MGDSNDNYHIIDRRCYINIGKKILENVGVSAEHAVIVMSNLLDADEKGIYTHGFYRLPIYVKQINKGNFNPRPDIREIRGGPNVKLINGDHGLGAVVSYYAMQEAIKISKELGIGIVGVRNSTHFGTAGYWAEMASKNNLIGIVFTNSAPSIAPTGSTKPIFGNNPWSVSIPTNREHPITLDISNSIISRGKIRIAALKGEPIPLGCALNKYGEPTTDAREALESKLILPIGGYKGYGIALIVDIIAGVLTGSAFADKVGFIDGDNKRKTGHLFMALNIEAFMDLDEFKERIEQLWNIVKCAPKFKEGTEIFLPGEKEWRLKLSQTEGTVKIPEITFKILRDLCNKFGVSLLKC